MKIPQPIPLLFEELLGKVLFHNFLFLRLNQKYNTLSEEIKLGIKVKKKGLKTTFQKAERDIISGAKQSILE